VRYCRGLAVVDVALDRLGAGAGVAVAGTQASLLVIVTTGGRDLVWPLERIEAQLLAVVGARPVAALFHGNARGADSLADQAARRLSWPVRPMLAQWSKFGASAGPIRNQVMLGAALALASSLEPGGQVILLAFPGGRGTQHCMREARKLRRIGGHPIEVQSA
jgi:hypothetical protein